jgi:hypothetical protein
MPGFKTLKEKNKIEIPVKQFKEDFILSVD